MHETYRSDFAESAAVRRMDRRLAEIESASGGLHP